MFGPLTATDLLKMIWWGLTHPAPPVPATVPSSTLQEVKRDLDLNPTKPVLVVSAPDHSYRQARLTATTAILCEEKGRKSLHEDHYPDQPPGTGFDANEGMKLTRIHVVVVQ